MDTSTAAIMERIGHSLDDATDDVLTEPLPKSLGEILSPRYQPNVLCTLFFALAHHEGFELIEQDGEIYIVPRSV
jgi:hypothetical protein